MIIGREDVSVAVSKKCNPFFFSFFFFPAVHSTFGSSLLFFLFSSEELRSANKECHQVWAEDVTTLGGQHRKTALCPTV